MWLCVTDLIHNYPNELVFSQDWFKKQYTWLHGFKMPKSILCLWLFTFFTAHLRSHGKVMLSLVSVCGSHVTITHNALDLTVQAAPPSSGLSPNPTLGQGTSVPPPTWDLRTPAPLLVTSGGYRWRPVQTWSLQDFLPPMLISNGWCSK